MNDIISITLELSDCFYDESEESNKVDIFAFIMLFQTSIATIV
jgi:hypothetical protein